MADVGIIGLGKLGLPTAITLALRGHQVFGYDRDPGRMTLDALAAYERGPDGEAPLARLLGDSLPLRFTDLESVARRTDCVLVAVQTPHGPRYEGVTPLPRYRADFGYDALVGAVRELVACLPDGTEIGIISTMLPGTMRRLIDPIVGDRPVVYCPQFVGMGTVARDLCHPEFVLLGQGARQTSVVRKVLSGLSDAPVFDVSYEAAELAKVLYNTFVSAKVGLSNLVQQLSDELGASSAQVFDVLRAADQRLFSTAYIGPGMGDGGPCHPRDNIALSWLARQLGLGSDLFSSVMEVRESYVEWLADRLVALAGGRPLVVLGTAFKPDTDIETGSSSVLLAELLRLRGVEVTTLRTPAELDAVDVLSRPSAYFLGCPEPGFLALELPAGSVVVDPWHAMPKKDGCTVTWIGEPAGASEFAGQPG